MGKLVTKVIVAAGVAIVGAAIAKELAKPSDQRTWQGHVAGMPYDFRPPTLAKIRRSLWDPDNPQLLTPHVFGVGWSVNVARLVARDRPAS